MTSQDGNREEVREETIKDQIKEYLVYNCLYES